jgi:hypothetical protein
MKNSLFALCALFFLSLTNLCAQDDHKVAAIGFYNLENLFDTINDPNTNDEEFLPTGGYLWDTKKYVAKQANMAKVVNLLATELTPDGVAILGVAEVENAKVLQDLVAQPQLKSRNYQVVHFESPDERGIDCGLLYQPKYFQVASSKALAVHLEDKSGKIDLTRDILYVSGYMDGELLHIMVGHWPSRRGGEAGSAWARAAAAKVCRDMADSLTAADPKSKVIIMGDLNDDPDSKSITKVLKARGDADGLKPGELYNPMYSLYKEGNGTMSYRDSWSLFDQMIVTQPFVDKKSGGWQLYKAIVFRQPWMMQTEGRYRGGTLRTFGDGQQFLNGYSDHLPVYLFFLKKKEVRP